MRVILRFLFGFLLLGRLFAAGPIQQGQADESFPHMEAVTQAVQEMAGKRLDVLAFIVYRVFIDHAVISQDGKTVFLWLGFEDRDSAEVIAAEPMPAIGQLQGVDPTRADSWQLTIPPDPEWKTRLDALPDDLISVDLKTSFLLEADAAATAEPLAIGGYKLPWGAGTAKMLEGSIGHELVYFSCINQDCWYAFDFADGTMFPLLASRGGVTWVFYDGCNNYNPDCSNYLVIKDTSTNPTTYQLYLHLAKNSIPASIRYQGAPIRQGQYIGNVDDTGYSDGHHLHFHVFTNFTSTYWGHSVDITFADVAVNGGRPRTCNEARNWPSYGGECIPGDWYISGNIGTDPPTGSISQPEAGAILTTPIMTVSGSAWDNLGITGIQVIARWNNTWHEIGSRLTSPTFSTQIDLCAAGVPTGPIDLGLRIWDLEGNMTLDIPGLRPIINNNNCSTITPPACVPDSNQVALFADANYRGTCTLVNIGEYDAPPEGFPNIGNNNIESLIVGSSVRLTMWSNAYFTGADETFESADSDLRDNRIRSNAVSSIKISERTSIPPAPTLYPVSATDQDTIILRWNGTYATSYAASLQNCPDGPACTAPPTLVQTMPAGNTDTWLIDGPLPTGTYRWSVTGINNNGTGVGASAIFNITAGNPPSGTILSAPYDDDLENGSEPWTTTGLWHWQEVDRDGAANHAMVFNNGTDYNTGGFPSGDLTSAPIYIPFDSPYELRFQFLAGTESGWQYWDRMEVQIANLSTNGKYETVWQVTDHLQGSWLASLPVDLSAYADQVIRIRFHFNALDDINNSGFGWVVDDISIQPSSPPPACAEPYPNDSRQTATPISLGQTVNASICPSGDMDYYAIQGAAGQHLSIRVLAGSLGSSLSPAITLWDAGGNFLASVDAPDEFGDSLLSYQLPQGGSYYIRVKAVDHPSAGGLDYGYRLSTMSGTIPPTVQILFPYNRYIPIDGFTARAAAFASAPYTVEAVTFYFHNTDWADSQWVLVNLDTDPSNGYSAYLDPALLGSLSGGALYVEARDSGGIRTGTLRMYLEADTIPPQVQVEALPTPSRTTVLQLHWSGSDAQTGLHHYEVEYQVNAGPWQPLSHDISPTQTSLWYLADFNQAVNFRVRAVDNAGNASADQITGTMIEATCVPDDYENADDLPTGATLLEPNDRQEHNACHLDDVDWYLFQAIQGDHLLIGAIQKAGGAAMRMEIYDSDLTMLISTEATGFDRSAFLRWTVPADGLYYLKLNPIHPGIAGTDADYRVWQGQALEFYLPVIAR